MEELVTIQNGQPVTSTKQVAETFEKNHKNIMRAVKQIKNDAQKPLVSGNKKRAQNCALLNSMFYEGKYHVPNNHRSYPMFYMNKDGFTLLVMGFTGRKATQFKLQYIAEFNRMAKQLEQQQVQLPQNYSEALHALVSQVDENERLKAKLQQQNFEQSVTNQIETSTVLYTTEEIAESCGYASARSLNKAMNASRIVYYRKGLWHLYYPYMHKGLKDFSTRNKSQLWTERGKQFITEHFDGNSKKEKVKEFVGMK